MGLYRDMSQYGWNELHIACRDGAIDDVDRLTKPKEHCNPMTKEDLLFKKTTDGWTPLHIACQRGHMKVVELLMDRGAEFNAKTNNGWTPLHLASDNGHADIVELLCKSKALWATPDEKESNGWTPFHLACRNGSLNVAKHLIHAGASYAMNSNSDQTPLDLARSSGHLVQVVKLIEEIRRLGLVESKKLIAQCSRH